MLPVARAAHVLTDDRQQHDDDQDGQGRERPSRPGDRFLWGSHFCVSLARPGHCHQLPVAAASRLQGALRPALVRGRRRAVAALLQLHNLRFKVFNLQVASCKPLLSGFQILCQGLHIILESIHSFLESNCVSPPHL